MKKIIVKGYTEGFCEAFADFDTFTEAEAFAEAKGGELHILFRRSGETSWEDHGRVWSPMTITAEDYGDDYTMYYNAEDYRDECEAMLEALEYREATAEEIAAEKERQAKIAERVAALKENEAVVLYRGEYYETTQVENVVKFSEDQHTYEIGVLVFNWNDEE